MFWQQLVNWINLGAMYALLAIGYPMVYGINLNGIIFIDRLSRLKRELVKRKYKKSLETEERAI